MLTFVQLAGCSSRTAAYTRTRPPSSPQPRAPCTRPPSKLQPRKHLHLNAFIAADTCALARDRHYCYSNAPPCTRTSSSLQPRADAHAHDCSHRSSHVRLRTRPLPSQSRASARDHFHRSHAHQHATTSIAATHITNIAVAAVAIRSPSSLKGSSTACLGSAAQLTAAPPLR